MATPQTTQFFASRAWLGGEDVTDDVMIEETGGVITSVETGVPAPSGAVRLPGVVLPGFANVHSHSFHRALRGRTERGHGTFWTWREQMYVLAERLTPDTLRALATATFAEMVCAGFSVVGEFHYLHHGPDGRPFDDPNEMARSLLDAAATAGIRLTLLDTCYLESGPGEAVSGVQRRFSDDTAGGWMERVGGLEHLAHDVVLGAAVHSARTVPPPAMREVVAWSDRRVAPLHAHVSEQPLENEVCLAAYGATPTALLARSGALSPRFTAVHATHLSGNDRAELARAGAGVCLCPTTERQLADGLVELSALRSGGITLSFGTDSHATIDPFEEARCAEGHERLRTLQRGTMSPGELLDAATAHGHRALGWPSGGSLTVGAPCDLVCVRTDSIQLAGTGDDDLSAVVAAGAVRDVATVVVGGRVVAQSGEHRAIDVASALDRAVSAAWA